MRVLHIVSTPRAAASNTLRISKAFFDALAGLDADVEVETLDLFADDLPSVAGGSIDAKYTLMMGQTIDPEHEESWRQIERLIAQFLAADVYVVSVPMWNFTIPYALKYFIDAVVQPGYLFRYDEQGVPEGLCHGKRMIVITSRGGDYSQGSPFHAYDFMEPYLRAVFGFVGIRAIEFVYAQPVDIREHRETAMESGMANAAAAAGRLLQPLEPSTEKHASAAGLKPEVVLPGHGEQGRREVTAGTVLFEESADSDVIYVIEDGAVEVYRSVRGEEVVIATLQAGQYFGELGVLLGQPRSAAARALSDAVLITLSAEEFRKRISQR